MSDEEEMSDADLKAEVDQSDANGRALALSYVNAVQCLRSLAEGDG